MMNSAQASKPVRTRKQPGLQGLFLCLICCVLLPLLPAASARANPALPDERVRPLSQFSSDMVRQTDPDADAEKPRTIRQIMTELGEVEKQYVDLLDEGSSATGLFLTGEYDSDYRNGEDKYYGQVELRLFNDGYLEERRKEDKKILQTRLELLQLNRDMDERALAEELYRLYTLENELHYRHSLARIDQLEKILSKRISARKNGYTTKTDVLALQHSLASARRERDFYTTRKREQLSPQLASVLNLIEQAQLKETDQLEEAARHNSPTLAIQDVFISRAEQFPSWSDNLAIDLFAGHRQEFYDLERNYVGIKVEVPLYWDDRKDDLIELQQRIYRFQKEATEQRISQNLDKLSAYFSFYQQKIESAVESLALLLAREQAAEEELRNPVQRDSGDPARLRQILKLNIIDTRFEALFHRLKEYELLLKIMALTGSQDIRDLFESAQPDSPDRSVAPRPHQPGPG